MNSATLPSDSAVDGLFNALGDPTRRWIFERICAAPTSVGPLVEALPVSQPAVSQHLRILRDAGLVTVSRDGRRRIYRARPEGLRALRKRVEGWWDGALAAFAASFEESPTSGERTEDGGGRR